MSIPETVTETIASFCTGTSFSDLPAKVIEKTKIHILDAIGAAFAGSEREETKNLIHFAEQWGGRPESTLITSKSKIPMVIASLVNGEMSHDTGLDDVYPNAAMHPAAVVLPAALAAAEREGVDGPAFITAIVLGYEIMLRMGDGLSAKALYNRGFHPTGICGPFGSTVAAGKILGLSQQKLVRALGISASQVGGLMEFLSDGSSVKRLHPARASQSGVLSVIFSQCGHTGPSTIIEGRNGVFKAYAESSNYSDLLRDLGKELKIMQTGLKLYPCTRYIEPSLNIVSDMQKGGRIDHREIDEITIHIFDAAFPIVVEPLEEKQRPRNAFSGQFSLPFCVAAALVRGRLTKTEFAVDVLSDKEIIGLAKKIKILPDAQMSKAFPRLWPSRVTIKTKRGTRLVGDVITAKGDPQNFPSLPEVIDKFSSLAKPVFPEGRVEEIIKTVLDLEKVKNMSSLGDLLRK